MATVNPEVVAAAVARARQRIAEQKALADKKAGKHLLGNMVVIDKAVAATYTPIDHNLPAVAHAPNAWMWNEEQSAAINYGTSRKSFCLIGAAGTGKTTTLKGVIAAMQADNKIPALESGSKNLSVGAPGIVLISFTRRAVRNIRKQMPNDLKAHCMTYHQLIEFGPEFYEKEIFDETGESIGMRNTMRFAPQKCRFNPLPRNLTTIVVDEASMPSIELHQQLLDALPNPSNVQFIFLGDLNQLPPVYGQAILGKALLELPIIELTRVYRQALESPIIALALAVKNNNFKDFNKNAVELWGAKAGFTGENVDAKGGKVTLYREGRGKVTLHPWKVKWEQDEALGAIKSQVNAWITSEEYLPDEDLILCPWNESFGCIELNKSIANKLGKLRGAEVYEVIAGFNKLYLAVGDKLMIDKQEAIILSIERNPKYMGTRPGPHSKDLDRWGCYHKPVAADADDFELTNDDIDALLESQAGIEDRTAQASHTIKLLMLDTDEEMVASTAAILNGATFGYAITVHKAQGSECRKVFFLTHYCHSAMTMRELVYTAITRAAEELYIVMSPMMLKTAANRPRIQGDTLAAKLAFYEQRLNERQDALTAKGNGK